MADLSVTAATVKAGANAITKKGTAGGTITAGMPLYRDSTDGKLKAAQADESATAEVEGIALHGAAADQPIEYVFEDDDFTPGATVAVGSFYVLSAAAAGGIAPSADLTSTDRVSFLFTPTSTSKVKLKVINTGAAVAGGG